MNQHLFFMYAFTTYHLWKNLSSAVFVFLTTLIFIIMHPILYLIFYNFQIGK